MNPTLRQVILKRTVALCDLVLAPLTLFAALLLKSLRRAGVARTPVSRAIFRRVGMFPIIDHYYEPRFDYRRLIRPLAAERELPGIDWNVDEQLALLARFGYNAELERMPRERTDDGSFYYNNGNFGAGDAEVLYSMIRTFKPARLVEIGAGFSTLMARNAIARNQSEQPGYACEHVCIEPYEMPWLDNLPGVTVLRGRVEESGKAQYAKLAANDILFIDSSHIIRPQGDVLFEYLEVLPALRPGVLVHVHDVFSPRDYPAAWLVDEVKFWNEQYLLEAFLSLNRSYKVIAALNHFFHHRRDALLAHCPELRKTFAPEPGSMWVMRLWREFNDGMRSCHRGCLPIWKCSDQRIENVILRSKSRESMFSNAVFLRLS